MKGLLEKWLEIKRIKYEKLYCKHEWREERWWRTIDAYTKLTTDYGITLYVCKKCGEFKKISV